MVLARVTDTSCRLPKTVSDTAVLLSLINYPALGIDSIDDSHIASKLCEIKAFGEFSQCAPIHSLSSPLFINLDCPQSIRPL